MGQRAGLGVICGLWSVGSRPRSESFFLRVLQFSLSSKTNASKFQFGQESVPLTSVLRKSDLFIYLFIYLFIKSL